MSIDSYQAIVAFGLAVRYIDEHRLISGNCYIWFDSMVY